MPSASNFAAATMFCLVSVVFTIEELSSAELMQAAQRNWGPEQATGEPDTPGSGDLVTAWASASPDLQKEWLICKYEAAQQVTEVVVHETFNPGAVYMITVLDDDDKEHLAWEGVDPTPRDRPRGVSVFPVKLDFNVQRIKIYIDSPEVTGWNEIDAVCIRNADKTQWAAVVEASSTYADEAARVRLVAPPIPARRDRFAELHELVLKLNERHKREIQQLRDEIKELKRLIETQEK